MSTCLVLKIYFEDRYTQQICDAPLVLAQAIDKGEMEAALDLTVDQPEGITQIVVEYE